MLTVGGPNSEYERTTPIQSCPVGWWRIVTVRATMSQLGFPFFEIEQYIVDLLKLTTPGRDARLPQPNWR